MPRKKERTPWYIWAFLGVLFILLLKAFGVLPDPPEYLEVAAGIGAAFGVVGGFSHLFNKMFGFERRLTTVETDLKTMKRDIAELKGDVKEIRDVVNQIKGKLGIP